MTKVPAYATGGPGEPLSPFTIERRAPRPDDVVIDILYCGICHSDIHQARDEWGNSTYPMVPGHEIVGRVVEVGRDVTRLEPGDKVGVGCFVDSCLECAHCERDLEQFCEAGTAFTYNGTEMDRETPTFGGYSTRIVVRDHFVLRVPEALDPAGAAPLLCAGITTFSPLRAAKTKAGDRVAVVGLGGLGHMAVKLARSMGAEVTVLSTSRAKEADARRLGATSFELTREEGTFEKLAGRFDLVIDSVSAPHDYGAYLRTLRPLGTMVLLGIPPAPIPLDSTALILGNRRLVGSNIGGIAETQAMLDYCGEHAIVSDVEVIPAEEINAAYDRVLRGDVRYRFVVDAASLKR
ncbi:MAG: NAD(P)-dependent alcohol dehydrogenase [Labilithrix sp.]|nr:NAD(P)-dependent alcohol dehydrogenase [Labilithrix sp.]